MAANPSYPSKQIAASLLDNAIAYATPGGKVQLRIRAAAHRAVLEVEDNGTGIPQKALPHIFERFYQADEARSRQMGGTGLGLSIVQAICLAHGGEIRFESSGAGEAGLASSCRLRIRRAEVPSTDFDPQFR